MTRNKIFPCVSGRERAIIKPEIIGGDESESEQSDEEAKHSSDSEEELDQDEVRNLLSSPFHSLSLIIMCIVYTIHTLYNVH